MDKPYNRQKVPCITPQNRGIKAKNFGEHQRKGGGITPANFLEIWCNLLNELLFYLYVIDVQ